MIDFFPIDIQAIWESVRWIKLINLIKKPAIKSTFITAKTMITFVGFDWLNMEQKLSVRLTVFIQSQP